MPRLATVSPKLLICDSLAATRQLLPGRFAVTVTFFPTVNPNWGLIARPDLDTYHHQGKEKEEEKDGLLHKRPPLPRRALLPPHLPQSQPPHPPRRPLADSVPAFVRRDGDPAWDERLGSDLLRGRDRGDRGGEGRSGKDEAEVG